MSAVRNPFFVIIVLLTLLIGSSTLTRGHEWGDDFASYIMQAQSILNGRTHEFVEHNTFTIYESSIQIGPVAYPWGYPLILTPTLIFKGIHPLTLKLPGLFFFIGFLICLYLLTNNRLTQTEALLLMALFAFNPVLVKFLDQILSDIPFLFFIFLTLLLITDPKLEQSSSKYIVLGTVIFFTFFIRTTGIILLASFLVYQVVRFYREQEERRTILINSVQVMVVFGLLWFVSSLIFPNGQGSYFRQLMGLTPDIFRRNILGYFNLFWQFFGNKPVWMYVYYTLIIFFIVGIWTRRNTDQLFIIFFSVYFTAMLFWPEWQGIRFIFPLLPIFIYFAIQGIKTIINKLPEKYQFSGTIIFNSFWLLIIGIFLLNSATHAYANLQNYRKINGPFDPYSSDVYNYINAETPADSVIVFFKPRAMRLFTNRNTVMIMDCDHLAIGDYIVISKKAENSQVPPDEIDKCGLALNNLFENQRFIVYKVPK